MEKLIRILGTMAPWAARRDAEREAEHARKTLEVMRRERDEARAETWHLREAVCVAADRPVTHDDARAWLASRGYPVDREGMLEVGMRNALLERVSDLLRGGLCSRG